VTSPTPDPSPTVHYFAEPVHCTVIHDGAIRAGAMAATRPNGDVFVLWDERNGSWVTPKHVTSGAVTRTVYRA